MSQSSTSPKRAFRPDNDVHLELALDIAGLGAFEFDLVADHMIWSGRASEIYGADSAELGAWPEWLSHVHADDRAAVQALRTSIDFEADRTEFEGVFRFLRPDGEERRVSKRCRVFRDGAGRAIRLYGVIADETDRRRSEQQASRLNQELQHRVKNVLAVVRSLSKRTLETSNSLEDYAAHFDGRLSAVARVQSMISRRANAGVDLEEIVREEFLQHAAEDDGQVDIEGPQLLLDAQPAEYIGLAIHELAVNAVKFGALSARKGRVEVTWALHAENKLLHLTWVEKGVPLIATNPARDGFGRQMIEQGLPYQLGAETSFNLAPGGLRCVMTIPIASPKESQS